MINNRKNVIINPSKQPILIMLVEEKIEQYRKKQASKTSSVMQSTPKIQSIVATPKPVAIKISTPLTNSKDSIFIPNSKIPRKIHFFWIGHQIPDATLKLIEHAQNLHPNWEVKLWRGVPQEMPFEFQRMLYNTKYLCAKSDVFRWWVLHEHGGVYLDCDIYLYRSLEPLLEKDHFFGHPLIKSKGIACAVLGSAPKHPLIKYAIDKIREVNTMVQKTGGHARLAYGPAILKSVLYHHQGSTNCLPQYQFYPFFTPKECLAFAYGTKEEQQKIIQDYKFEPEPYGCHVYGMDIKPVRIAKGSTHWMTNHPKMDDFLINLPYKEVKVKIVHRNPNWLKFYLLGHRPDLKFVESGEDFKFGDGVS